MNYHQLLEEILKIYKTIEELKKILETTVKPPDQVVLDDVDLREYLKVSKRTTAYWREKAMITYFQPGGKIYYLLSDILAFLKNYEITATDGPII